MAAIVPAAVTLALLAGLAVQGVLTGQLTGGAGRGPRSVAGMPAPDAETVLTGNVRAGAGARAGAAAGSGAGAGRGAPGGGRGRPVLLAGLGAACISASAVLVALASTGTATAAFYRCVFALPVLVLLAGLEQRRRGGRPLRARLGAAFAGVFLGIDLVLWNHAIADVGAGIATVLGNLQVLFVTAAAWVLFRERPGRRFLLMLPVVLTGVVLVSGLAGAAPAGDHPLAGVEYGLGTSIAYAFFLLILRQATSGTPHVAGPLAEATAGSAFGALMLGLIFGGLPLAIGLRSFAWLVLLALTSQTIGWLLITSSLPRLPAAISSLLLLLQPAAAIALAAVILGQRPSLLQIAGAVAVCGGVLVATRQAAPGRQNISDNERIGDPPDPAPAGSARINRTG